MLTFGLGLSDGMSWLISEISAKKKKDELTKAAKATK
jgi:hypothetical protein